MVEIFEHASPKQEIELGQLLASVGIDSKESVRVSGISHDHRKIEAGWIFAALPGFRRHGAEFVAAAISAGAVAVLTDTSAQIEADVPVIKVSDPRSLMGYLAAEIYGHPGEKLLSVGVTGTNGKTTTSHMVYAALMANELQPLLLGTAGNRFGKETWAAERTTPEATDLHAMLACAQRLNGRSVVMEVSSHALRLGRVHGMKFDVAIFTGLSQDHLDFHKDMADYFAAKSELFTESLAKRAVICIEDEWGVQLAANTKLPYCTYGFGETADWRAVDVQLLPSGRSKFRVLGPDEFDLELTLSLPGDFNVLNALAAIAASAAIGLIRETSAQAIANVNVPGRLERIDCGQDFVALVDYAHTPDAVARVLEVARTCTSERLIAVLGCGGDRDTSKRAPMGAAAASNADIVLITDDNPRSEDPSAIRAEVLLGTAGRGAEVIEIDNRLAALHRAVQIAQPGDCVIVLGKGHETGQETKGVVLPFDDRQVLAESIMSVIK